MHNQLDLQAIRERLAQTHGRRFWRSLDELAETQEFQEFLDREFPRGAAELLDPVTRRTFLKLMGASVALAGLAACSGPTEKIVPYVQQPEELIPGKPLFYATAFPLGGYAQGVLVESNMGRPTKIEGNDQHPDSLGATDAITQASLLGLYDPDRSQTVLNLGRPSTWEVFTAEMQRELETQRARRGAGLRILTETVTSPTLAAQLRGVLQRFPAAVWHQYEPLARDNARAGAVQAFGQPVNTVYRFEQADVVLALDADFLLELPGHLRYARAFVDKRRAGERGGAMNRLYVVESTPTITGAMADHRLPLRAAAIEGFARALAQGLGVAGVSGGAAPGGSAGKWLAALVKDLKANAGRGVVVPGEGQPPAVHALAHAINAALGNAGKTVIYTDPVEANSVDQGASLRALVDALNAKQVDLLFILGGNPVYTAPADLRFADALQKAPTRVHLGLYEDETAALSQWHIPETHYLEAWGDARAFDGTISIMQPLIAPLYGGRSAHELLGLFGGQASRSSYDIVREYWGGQKLPGDFEAAWRRALHSGFVAGTALPPRQVALRSGMVGPAPAAPGEGELELNFRRDPSVWDGRFANNGWLQELPKPLSKLTWDNAALIAPATAQQRGLNNEDVIELRYQGGMVVAPVWIMPGQPADVVTVYLGYGHTIGGRVARGAGFNAYMLRTSSRPYFGAGLELRKTGNRYLLSTTQAHWSLEGRELIRVATLAEYKQQPDFARAPDRAVDTQSSLLPEYVSSDGYAWGMAINLNACIGCNACVLACQAENNIPIVGKQEVRKGREMHWLVIDRYYEGNLDAPETLFQPRPCMHCEKAPCEIVCPVAATSHSDEGLNQQTYNRCVGTKYCSNNCPYKVRRFNFFQYTDKKTPVIELMQNPDVTVRDRGVMEKCTYCVQRINQGRIEARKADRKIQDNEVRTACQQVCPTDAIVFGNVADPNARVAQLRANPLNYALLAELGTRPRTTYGARLRNPNPEIEEV